MANEVDRTTVHPICLEREEIPHGGSLYEYAICVVVADSLSLNSRMRGQIIAVVSSQGDCEAFVVREALTEYLSLLVPGFSAHSHNTENPHTRVFAYHGMISHST